MVYQMSCLQPLHRAECSLAAGAFLAVGQRQGDRRSEREGCLNHTSKLLPYSASQNSNAGTLLVRDMRPKGQWSLSLEKYGVPGGVRTCNLPLRRVNYKPVNTGQTQQTKGVAV